ncbi:MAG: hypothetical protein WBK76_00505 [Candidatus Saccharimonadales bacterium]
MSSIRGTDIIGIDQSLRHGAAVAISPNGTVKSVLVYTGDQEQLPIHVSRDVYNIYSNWAHSSVQPEVIGIENAAYHGKGRLFELGMMVAAAQLGITSLINSSIITIAPQSWRSVLLSAHMPSGKQTMADKLNYFNHLRNFTVAPVCPSTLLTLWGTYPYNIDVLDAYMLACYTLIWWSIRVKTPSTVPAGKLKSFVNMQLAKIDGFHDEVSLLANADRLPSYLLQKGH